jgi:hypothetical protein
MQSGGQSLHTNKLVLTVGPHWTGTVFASGVDIAGTVMILMQQRPAPAGWFVLVCMLFATATFVLLWLTACSDPGMIRQSCGESCSADVYYMHLATTDYRQEQHNINTNMLLRTSMFH